MYLLITSKKTYFVVIIRYYKLFKLVGNLFECTQDCFLFKVDTFFINNNPQNDGILVMVKF